MSEMHDLIEAAPNLGRTSFGATRFSLSRYVASRSWVPSRSASVANRSEHSVWMQKVHVGAPCAHPTPLGRLGDRVEASPRSSRRSVGKPSPSRCTGSWHIYIYIYICTGRAALVGAGPLASRGRHAGALVALNRRQRVPREPRLHELYFIQPRGPRQVRKQGFAGVCVPTLRNPLPEIQSLEERFAAVSTVPTCNPRARPGVTAAPAFCKIPIPFPRGPRRP